MKHLFCKSCLVVAIFTGTGSVFAFELATHGLLTYRAYEESVISTDPLLVESYGIEDMEEVFDKDYMDVSGSSIMLRTAPDVFSREIIENTLHLPGKSFTAAGWLMRGAIREDDHLTSTITVCVT